jgi:CheY-like chemotaxis protein
MKRRVVAVVPDLFFATRIVGTAESLGVAVELPGAETAFETIRGSLPDLVILDLTGPGEPLALARSLKGDAATRAIPLVGFYPHVDNAVRAGALAAGVDHVLPRSAFTARLADLLAGEDSSPQ